MATVVMKNRVTTEYRKVEKDSDEFWALRAELHGDGRPRWEQTGEHDLSAFEGRLQAGQLRDTDIGDAAGPAVIPTEGPASVPGLDHGFPTPGELDQRAGRAADMSDDEIARWKGESGQDPDFATGEGVTVQSATAGADSGAGYPAGHPPTTDDGEEDNLTGTSEERRVKEGVADDPLPTGGQGTDLSDEGESVQKSYDDMTVSELKAAAEGREGLTVSRGDGSDGAPVRDDYVTALEADDATRSDDEEEESDQQELGT